jgi:hypothetical protein
LEDAQFRPPVREREHQSLEIRVASQNLGFDGGDLASAAFDLDS